MTINTHGRRRTYVALVQALRAEFTPTERGVIWLWMREHRYNTSSFGALAQACHDADDRAYLTGEADPWA